MRSTIALLFAVCLAVGGSRAARADQPAAERDLSLLNHASQAINEIYVTPSSTDHWGEDRLGDRTLPPGQSVRIRLGHERDCEFDVQVVYEDASREEAHGVNVCRTRQFAFDGSGAKAPKAGPAHDVTIVNRSPRPIQQVLISPTDAGDWGDDRLGNASISVGEATTLRYRGDCVADLRVVFDNRAAEERRGINICTARRIAVRPGWTTADAIPTEAQPGEEAVQLTIRNNTGRRVVGLFLLADGSDVKGPQLLGEAGLAVGASVTVAFARPTGTCGYAARLLFAPDRTAADVTGIDLCRSLDLVLPPGT